MVAITGSEAAVVSHYFGKQLAHEMRRGLPFPLLRSYLHMINILTRVAAVTKSTVEKLGRDHSASMVSASSHIAATVVIFCDIMRSYNIPHTSVIKLFLRYILSYSTYVSAYNKVDIVDHILNTCLRTKQEPKKETPTKKPTARQHKGKGKEKEREEQEKEKETRKGKRVDEGTIGIELQGLSFEWIGASPANHSAALELLVAHYQELVADVAPLIVQSGNKSKQSTKEPKTKEEDSSLLEDEEKRGGEEEEDGESEFNLIPASDQMEELAEAGEGVQTSIGAIKEGEGIATIISVLDAITAFTAYEKSLPSLVMAKFFILARDTFKLCYAICHSYELAHREVRKQWQAIKGEMVKAEAERKSSSNAVVAEEQLEDTYAEEQPSPAKQTPPRRGRNTKEAATPTEATAAEQGGDHKASPAAQRRQREKEERLRKKREQQEAERRRKLEEDEERDKVFRSSELYALLSNEGNVLLKALRASNGLRQWMREERHFIAGHSKSRIPSLAFSLKKFELELQRMVASFPPSLKQNNPGNRLHLPPPPLSLRQIIKLTSLPPSLS